jgi:hypothetical protein
MQSTSTNARDFYDELSDLIEQTVMSAEVIERSNITGEVIKALEAKTKQLKKQGVAGAIVDDLDADDA